MRINKNIRKAFVLFCWLVISSGVLVLLIAAVNIKNRETCKAVDIDITGVEEFFFLDKQDVRDMIVNSEMEKPEGKAVAGFNLQKLEETLEKNVWVRDAELFFDNNMILHVNISEREPIARIFTSAGKSYYIDSSVHAMPLTDKMNIRIPVFTGFPSEKIGWKGNDLQLMREVRDLASAISTSDFFKAQIAQVDITPSRNFEMIPVIGNHIIEFGNGKNAAAKFKKLFIFYHQVLSQSGFDRYSRINVQYDKQVVGTRRGFVGKIDSVQAMKNIQKMIEESKKIATDSVFTFVDKNVSMLKKADSTLSVNTAPIKHDSSAEASKQAPAPSPENHPAKTYPPVDPVKKPKPKAVMPGKGG